MSASKKSRRVSFFPQKLKRGSSNNDDSLSNVKGKDEDDSKLTPLLNSTAAASHRSAPNPNQTNLQADIARRRQSRRVSRRESAESKQKEKHAKARVLMNSMTNGPLTYRVLALLGGLAMMVSNAVMFGHRAITVKEGHDVVSLVLSAYGSFFGALIVLLEGAWSFPPIVHATLQHYALFLHFTTGRGVAFFFAGSLQVINWTILDWAIGGYMMVVGIIAVIVGVTTSRKLIILKQSMITARDMRLKWAEADVDKNGQLDIRELALFVKNNDIAMNPSEVITAFRMIDKDYDEKIDFNDFYMWWSGRNIPMAAGNDAV